MGNDWNGVLEDRLEALRIGGEDALIAAMARVPLISDAAAGEGPLAVRMGPSGLRWGPSRPVTNRVEMARLLSSDLAIQAAMMTATRIEQQLLGLAAWHGGELSRDETIAETGADPDVLDSAATGLRDAFLSDQKRGWMVLRPGVQELVALPGVSVRMECESLTSSQIEVRLRSLGVSSGTRKRERVDALEAALRDPSLVAGILDTLQPEDRAVFDRLARLGHTDVSSLGGYPAMIAMEQLASAGLVVYSPWEGEAWVWLDVLVALNGYLYDDWTAPGAEPKPLSGADHAGVPPVVGRLDQLLDRWASSPPAALKTGGLGVRPVRTAAKALGVPGPEIGVLAALAIELGLLAPVVTSRRGRGRRQAVDRHWQCTTSREEWSGKPAWQRWATLVQKWLDSDQLDVSGKAIERHEWSSPMLNRPMTRVAFVNFLDRLEEGSGIEPQELATALTYRHHGLMAPAIADQLVGEARALGLVTTTGPVGLTGAARTLLAGVAELEAMTEATADNFTVQADHTVIAPPDLDADVASNLERIARLESGAGARIYRITDEDLVRAFDAGWTADQVLEFLTAHSTVPVAQNVERTIHDAADRHGRLVVGSATTWVACDDPALLARAVAVRAAKLEAVTPTLAVSDLKREKVVQVLRDKGLAPGERSEPAPAVAPSPRSSPPGLELRARPIRSLEDIAALAKQVGEGPEPTEEEIPYTGTVDDWDGELAELIRLFEEDEA